MSKMVPAFKINTRDTQYISMCANRQENSEGGGCSEENKAGQRSREPDCGSQWLWRASDTSE